MLDVREWPAIVQTRIEGHPSDWTVNGLSVLCPEHSSLVQPARLVLPTPLPQ